MTLVTESTAVAARPILCFQHCTRKAHILCLSLPLACPICDKAVDTNDKLLVSESCFRVIMQSKKLHDGPQNQQNDSTSQQSAPTIASSRESSILNDRRSLTPLRLSFSASTICDSVAVRVRCVIAVQRGHQTFERFFSFVFDHLIGFACRSDRFAWSRPRI